MKPINRLPEFEDEMEDDDSPVSHADILEVAKAVRQTLQEDLQEWQTTTSHKLIAQTAAAISEMVEGIVSRLIDEHVTAQEKDFEDRLNHLSTVYERLMKQVMDVVQSLPTPQVHVNVPENAIQVAQPKSINVSLPEKSINVTVKPAVTLNAPKRQTTRDIVYDPATGRPTRIVESEE